MIGAILMQPPHFIRYGTSFKDGKLYEFSGDGILVLRQWPDLRAWRRTPKGRQWQQVRPLLRLQRVDSGWSCEVSRRESKVRPMLGGLHIRDMLARDPDQEDQEDEFMDVLPDEQNEAAAVAEPTMAHIEPAWVIARRAESLARRSEFLTPIPEEVLAAVAPYSSRHWHLLNLIAHCPGALDLVRSTPALAFALASLWAFRNPSPRQPLRAARALLRKRQPEIAAWLGFLVRSSSCNPNVFSSSAICLLSWVCTLVSPCATRVMLPARTTFSNDCKRASETPPSEKMSFMTTQSCHIL